MLVEELTAESFADGISRAASLTFDPTHIRKQSLRFSLERFHDDMRSRLEGAPLGRSLPGEHAAW